MSQNMATGKDYGFTTGERTTHKGWHLETKKAQTERPARNAKSNTSCWEGQTNFNQ